MFSLRPVTRHYLVQPPAALVRSARTLTPRRLSSSAVAMGCDFYEVKTLEAEVRNREGQLERIDEELARTPRYMFLEDDDFQTYEEQAEEYKASCAKKPAILMRDSKWSDDVSKAKREEWVAKFAERGELVSLRMEYWTYDR